jgi:ParB family chromosome partitioning protein
MTKYPELAGYKTLEIPIRVIYFDREFNCRGVFTPQSCVELADSMRTKGLKIPIMVQPRVDVPNLPDDFEYRVVAGHRRFTAAKYLLHWQTIPSTVVSGLTDEDARVLNLLENLERKNLTVLQEARALRKSFPQRPTFRQMAEALNKSESWCKVRWRLLELPDDIQQLAANGTFTISDLKLLLYKDPQEQAALASEIQAAKLHGESTRTFARSKGQLRVARSKSEIDEMLTNLMAEGRYPDPYRALAWAAGHLSAEQFLGESD